MDEFQKLLKEHIQRKGRHNISELAKEVGLTSAGFSKWLNGRVKHPDCGKVVRCAEVLGLTPEERRKFFKAVDCRENIVPAQPHFPAEASPVVGRAVLHPRQFFGQTEQLKRVKRAWRQAPPLQHVALIGPRGSGKTSFLHYLKNISLAPQAELRESQPQGWDAWRPDDFQFALVDFQDAAMCQVESLQRSILEQLNCNIPDSYRTIDFAGTMNNNIHKPTVIMMDEIGAGLLAPELDMKFWWSMRALGGYCGRGKLGFVIAAHEPIEKLVEDCDKPSPFFNLFIGNALPIGPLLQQEAEELINSFSKPFTREDAAWILKKSGCWPALLQILCDERLFALEENKTDESWKENALKRILPLRYLLK